MSKSTRPRQSGKPKFPLWHHKASGRWCKKTGSRFHYFTLVEKDPTGEQALDEWGRLKDGRPPRSTAAGPTLRELTNKWINRKKELLESGELAQRTYDSYYASCAFLLATLGKNTPVEQLGPDDFQRLRGRMAKAWGPIRLKIEMGVVNSIFRFGEEAGLWDRKTRFGPAWTKPSATAIRKARAKNGPRLFTAGEILKALEAASTNMRCMILLGVQGGLGNTDLGLLPIKAFDLDAQWLDYPRSKTGVCRRIPLWSETVEAVRRVLAERREPKDPADASLLFIGKRGESYVGNHKGYRVTQEMARTLKRAGIEGRTFYDLRRTFQTVGEEAGDLVAVQSIMGHAPASGDMSAIYRQRVSDDRLQRVTDCVHTWLYNKAKGGK